jgi:beta-lactamase class A
MSAHLRALCTKKNISIFSIVLIIVVSSGVSFFSGMYMEKVKYTKFLSTFRNVRENSDKYMYINPLIGGVSAPATDVGIYTDIKSEVVSYLRDEIKAGNLYGYSIYFRDFNTGLWFGGRENVDFSPASLFKLPIAIAIYKQIENDPAFAQKVLVYTKELSDINEVKQLNAESTLVIGQTYTINELIEKMLVSSDNGAKNLLLSVLDKKYLEQLLNLVNFANIPTQGTYEISSRKYANFLRILYGSSYINEDHSEYILGLLAKSDFKDGLVAGLPVEVKVAHKFGVYEFPEVIDGKEVMTVQLHDCGVVYQASDPYVLCVMTKGKDDASLFRVISTVSKKIYEYQLHHQANGID